MRLTKKIREDVLAAAIKDIFEVRCDSIIKQVNELGDEVYDAQFGKDARQLEALELEHLWLSSRSKTCRFTTKKDNAAHLHTRETGWLGLKIRDSYLHDRLAHRDGCNVELGKTRIFPPFEGGYLRLTKPGHIKRFEALQSEAMALIDEETELVAELDGFLAACKTRQQVIDNWPEGEKYLPVVEKPKQLPIPLVDNVRKAMGVRGV